MFQRLQIGVSSMVVEFIEGWNLHHILGEGTFGEVNFASLLNQLCKTFYQVKLLVNKENGEACAMKEVRNGKFLTEVKIDN